MRARKPLTYRDPHAADPTRRSGVNAASTTTWGSRVAPVTGRNARKSAGWKSAIAGGEYVTVAPVRHVVTDRDLGVRNHPLTIADVSTWAAFTAESAARALTIIGNGTHLSDRRRAVLIDQVTARTLYR